MAKGVIHVLKDFITLPGLRYAGAGLEEDNIVISAIGFSWNYVTVL